MKKKKCPCPFGLKCLAFKNTELKKIAFYYCPKCFRGVVFHKYSCTTEVVHIPELSDDLFRRFLAPTCGMVTKRRILNCKTCQ